MPPKVKTTKDDIINSAMSIVRQQGEQALNARNIATMLSCSTQPIFSNFSSMEELKKAVLLNADKLYQEYIDKDIASNAYPPYKASGMAYIRFAKYEKELFKLLYMRDRSGQEDSADYTFSEQISSIVQKYTGLDGTKKELFHLEMWAYVHGIATMFATGFLDLDWDLISQMLTDVYLGMRKQYGVE